MRNVIIFLIAGERFGVELRWVNEVITLAPVTAVPGAPDVVVGVINYRGAIIPVLDVSRLTNEATRAAWNLAASKMAIILDVEKMRTCLIAERIEEVSTLTGDSGEWKDSRGQAITLLEPPSVVHAARRMIDSSVTAAS